MNIEQEDKRRRITLMMSRLTGLFVSCAIFIALLLYYFMQIDYMIMTLVILVLSGVNFTLNASIKSIKDVGVWSRVNALFSVIFFLAGIGLLVYGYITGLFIWF